MLHAEVTGKPYPVRVGLAPAFEARGQLHPALYQQQLQSRSDCAFFSYHVASRHCITHTAELPSSTATSFEPRAARQVLALNLSCVWRVLSLRTPVNPMQAIPYHRSINCDP